MSGKTLAQLKVELMDNPEFKAAYDALDEEFALARELIAARARAELTQDELARRMQTSQSAVARLESGKGAPGIKTLRRFAEATGSRLRITFEPISPLR